MKKTMTFTFQPGWASAVFWYPPEGKDGHSMFPYMIEENMGV